jgi:hypothetical protein
MAAGGARRVIEPEDSESGGQPLAALAIENKGTYVRESRSKGCEVIVTLPPKVDRRSQIREFLRGFGSDATVKLIKIAGQLSP